MYLSTVTEIEEDKRRAMLSDVSDATTAYLPASAHTQLLQTWTTVGQHPETLVPNTNPRDVQMRQIAAFTLQGKGGVNARSFK